MERTTEQEKGLDGLLQDGVHKKLIKEIMELSEEEVQVVIRLLAALQT